MTRRRVSRRALVALGAALMLSAVPLPSRADTRPNDPDFPYQWSLENTGQVLKNWTRGTPGADINVTKAWDLSTGSRSIIVGLIDNGLDYTDPTLVANVWSNPGGVNGCPRDTHGYDVGTKTCNPRTAGGNSLHGTDMARIMGSVGNDGVGITGVNWATSIMGVSHPPSGDQWPIHTLASFDWVVRAAEAGANVRVINASIGGMGNGGAERDVVARAAAKDILIVAGAGNDPVDRDADPEYPCNWGAANTICVAATDQDDRLWSRSAYGADSVDLAAPGVNICTGTQGTCDGAGTSDATAMVSGAAALILSHRPNLTAAQLKQLILDNVRPVPGLAGKVRTGGILDVYTAMTAPLPPPGATTSTSAPTTPTTGPTQGGGPGGGVGSGSGSGAGGGSNSGATAGAGAHAASGSAGSPGATPGSGGNGSGAVGDGRGSGSGPAASGAVGTGGRGSANDRTGGLPAASADSDTRAAGGGLVVIEDGGNGSMPLGGLVALGGLGGAPLAAFGVRRFMRHRWGALPPTPT